MESARISGQLRYVRVPHSFLEHVPSRSSEIYQPWKVYFRNALALPDFQSWMLLGRRFRKESTFPKR
jgi:hypothetical protein